MRRLLQALVPLLLILYSCNEDKRLADYSTIVDGADKIVFYTRMGDTFSRTREVVSPDQLADLKAILKRNIKPETQRKFIANHKIEMLSYGKVTGVLLISGIKENPFVNFKSDNLGFGFRLTYGIGMSL